MVKRDMNLLGVWPSICRRRSAILFLDAESRRLRAGNGGREAVVVNGFQEVVEGRDFEGFEGMPFVGSQDGDGGEILFGKGAEDFEAVHTGHLDVKEDEVRGELENFLDGGAAVLRRRYPGGVGRHDAPIEEGFLTSFGVARLLGGCG